MKNQKTHILTPMNSIVNALRYLSVNNPLVVSPYSSELHKIAINFLKVNRFICSSHINKMLDNSNKLLEYSATTIKNDIETNFLQKCDSIVFLCTNLPTYHLSRSLREHYDVPVISSNSALFWDALCQTSYFKEKSLLETLFIN